MRLHRMDLRTRQVESLKETNGLWSPRWSPDGKSLLAITTDNRTIRISPSDASYWRDVISMHDVDNVTWSYDSQSIYFSGRAYLESEWALYRINVVTGALQKLVDMKDFPIPIENWWGVAPDGTLLGSKNSLSEEIYELRCKLP